MQIPNSMFVSTVLAVFARTMKIPATAIGEMQITGLLRELFGLLGATDEMADEYTAKVLRRWPPRKRPPVSESLRMFLDNRTSPGLLHKYEISPEDLVTTWNFDCLDDPSVLEAYSIGAKVDCEHHTKWLSGQDKETPAPEPLKHFATADDELADALSGDDNGPDNRETGRGEIDSLMEL